MRRCHRELLSRGCCPPAFEVFAQLASRARFLALLVGAVIVSTQSNADDPVVRPIIRVGIDSGDLRGDDQRALQAAIDHVGTLGGGDVQIGPGRYVLRNALTLRDRVRLRGEPGKTVLALCDGAESKLACDGDCNERQVTLESPAAFQIGDGVSIQDDQFGGGFTVTTATLTSKPNERTFALSSPLYLDYMVAKRATARLASPAVGGWGIRDASVEDLVIEGNQKRRARLDGCRGGGIYLFECKNVAIRNCVVRDYNGDGISFQVSEGITVEGCTAEGNASLGIHPGSGSRQPIVRNNVSMNNGGDGLFVCWRVQRGVFEANVLKNNAGAGISIGHKDSDNVFRDNEITANRATGVLFREETEPMGAHRNEFVNNRILDNGPTSTGETAAAITIRGVHHDLVFRGNQIGNTRGDARDAIGILQSPKSEGLKSEANRFVNVRAEIEQRP